MEEKQFLKNGWELVVKVEAFSFKNIKEADVLACKEITNEIKIIIDEFGIEAIRKKYLFSLSKFSALSFLDSIGEKYSLYGKKEYDEYPFLYEVCFVAIEASLKKVTVMIKLLF